MGATTTEGVGRGSVENIMPRIYNGVVKTSNIPPNQVTETDMADAAVTESKLSEASVTSSKIADGAVVLSKAGWMAGGLKAPGEVVTMHYLKAKATFATSPDRTTLEIANNQPDNSLDFQIAYKKIASTFSSGVTGIDPAVYNTFHQIATVNSDGEMVEAYVMDRSFHNTYRITMQVRQSDSGYVHLVVEHLAGG